MTKLINMTADTAPDRASYVYLVDSPGGTPADTYSTLANAVKNGITRYVTIPLFDKDTNPSAVVGANYISIPPDVSGMNLTYVFASFCVVGTGNSGTCNIDIHNVTDTADMLSTNLTIDANELSSATAAAAAVIANADVVTNDQLRIDVDSVPTTSVLPYGLYVTLGFSWPT